MGEIAEMMLDGTLCEACGAAFDPDHEPPGHPVYCSAQCAMDRGAIYAPMGHGLIRNRRKKKPQFKKLQCPDCNRFFATEAARTQHAKAKHFNAEIAP